MKRTTAVSFRISSLTKAILSHKQNGDHVVERLANTQEKLCVFKIKFFHIKDV